MKVVFPIPRMGKPNFESPTFYAVAVGLLVGLGLSVTGLAVLSNQSGQTTSALTINSAPKADGTSRMDVSHGLVAGFHVADRHMPIRTAVVSIDEQSTASVTRRIRRAPAYPSTRKVLDLLDGLLVTYKYTPYFIIYNREVENLQNALRELSTSREKDRLPKTLFQYIDEASYSHVKLRAVWRIKTNPLKSQEDIADYLREIRMSIQDKTKQFRGIKGTAKPSVYENAVGVMIEDASEYTQRAQLQFARLGDVR